MKKIFCDMRRCAACRSCEMACALEHSISKNIYKFLEEERLPKNRVKVSSVRKGGRAVSVHCQHCTPAPCVSACMSGAMSKDKETGATMHDADKCIGCWMCVMACPFGAIVREISARAALKCDLCPGRDGYACVEACPTGALFAGTREEFIQILKEKEKESRKKAKR